eukprot:scaffold264193_cov14-Tisochrysis_lutea.AAC.1
MSGLRNECMSVCSPELVLSSNHLQHQTQLPCTGPKSSRKGHCCCAANGVWSALVGMVYSITHASTDKGIVSRSIIQATPTSVQAMQGQGVGGSLVLVVCAFHHSRVMSVCIHECVLAYAPTVNRRMDEWVQLDQMDLSTVE